MMNTSATEGRIEQARKQRAQSIHISICMTGKNKDVDAVDLSYGLKPVSLTIDELIAHAKSGKPFVQWILTNYKDGRKDINFSYQDVLALDMDGAVTLATHMDKHSNITAGYYTSFNHQKFRDGIKTDRFRCIFILPFRFRHKAMSDIVLKMATTVFLSDPQYKSINTPCYGNSEAETWVNPEPQPLDLQWLHDTYKQSVSQEEYDSVVRTVCRKHDLNVDDLNTLFNQGALAVECTCLLPTFSHPYNIPIEVRENGTEQDDEDASTNDAQSLPRIQRFDFDYLRSSCHMIKNFNEAQHSERMHLLMNMVNVDGGRKYALNLIEKTLSTQHREEYARHYKYIRKYKNRSRCASQCRFYGTGVCSDPLNLVNLQPNKYGRVRREKIGEAVYRPLEEVRTELPPLVQRLVSEDDGGIHVIIAALGAGKTTAINLAELPPGTVIAGPTHRMLEEITQGVAYPPLPESVRKIAQPIYAIGLSALKELQTLPLTATQKTDLEQYEMQANAALQSSVIRITHHRLVLDGQLNITGPIIIDEDISSILLPEDSVGTGWLQDYIERQTGSPILHQVLLWFEKALNSSGLVKNDLRLTKDEHQALARSLMDSSLEKKGNAIGLAMCDYCVQADGKLHFIKHHPLPDGRTAILLSATVNPDMIRRLYPGREVVVHNLGHVRPEAELQQFTYKGFSRRSLTEDKPTRQLAESIIKRARQESFIVASHLFMSDHDIHFGAAEGLNDFAGQDLLVIGTPHIPPCSLRLRAAALGFSNEANSIRNYHDVQAKPVSYEMNGYRYHFHCRKLSDYPPILRMQIDFTLSGLLQVVGRSRFNEHKSRVIVHSNFPLPDFEYDQSPIKAHPQ